MDKYKNKYRIASNRNPYWDYSSNGLYFLTIVTQNRECNLGEIVNENGNIFLKPSDFGKIVEHEWHKSFEIRNELILHAFILMPNHLHTIVEMNHENNLDKISSTGNRLSGNRLLDNQLSETHGRASLANDSNNSFENLSIKRNAPIRLPKSISSFIGGFKSAVNTKIDDYIDEHQLKIPKYNRKNHFFQPNYHDHIIRNYKEYQNIKNYIINNPLNWYKDKFSSNR